DLTAEQIDTLKLIQGVIRLSEHILIKDKKEIIDQLWCRLVGIDNLDIQDLLLQAKETRKNAWLRPLYPSLMPPNTELIRTIKSQAEAVTALAVTPDNQQIISGSRDNIIKVWNLDTGKEIFTLTGHTKEITSLAITNDGNKLISASEDTTIKVWNFTTKTEIITLTEHTAPVTSVTITPDEKELISSSDDGTVKIWDLETGENIYSIKAHKKEVKDVAVTPNGEEIISVSYDKTIKIWNRKTRKLTTSIEGNKAEYTGVVVTPDGQRMIVYDLDGEWDFFFGDIIVFDLATGEKIYNLSGHQTVVESVAVTSDSKFLISVSGDSTIKVWDLETGVEFSTLRDHDGYVNTVVISSDGKRIISGGFDTTIKVWDLEKARENKSLGSNHIGHEDEVNAVAITPDNKWMISGGVDGILKVWDLTNFAEVFSLNLKHKSVNDLAISSDGKEVFVAFGDSLPRTKSRAIKFLDPETEAEILTFSAPFNLGNFMALIPNTELLLSGYWGDRGITIWDLASKEEIGYLGPYEESALCVTVTPDGQKAICGYEDGTIIIWDLETEEQVLMITEDIGLVYSLAITPDGKQFISASEDEYLRVWDLETGEQVGLLKGHKREVLDVVILPNNRAISASVDKTLKVWDLEKKKAIANFSVNSGLRCCTVAKDGVTVVAGDYSGRLHFLRLEG
ncbi:MAG: WD40 repeat domain-containing protein, partial [Microcoleaceae cyanobacterium]